MRLDLVHSGGDLCRLQQLLQLANSEVTHANAADLARLDEFLKSCPCVGDGNFCEMESLGDWVQRSECFVGVFECDWPVDLVLSG